jgi:uncharacterized membrane protein YagU involved in acid resistance
MKRLTPLQAILIGGAIGGLGDILFAIGMALARGDTAVHLLQIVASGAMGQPAFDGGMRTAALGLALHFGLSFGWAALFVMAARAMPALVRHPLVSAVVYGALVLLAMRLVALPLSAFPFPSGVKPSWPLFLDLLSHVFLFALPIVLAARRISAQQAP